MLAELCGHGNGALIDRTWKVAKEAFSRFAHLVIDDVLWRSKEKLMRKARSMRDSCRGSSLFAEAAICLRATSSHGNTSSASLNKKKD